MSKERKPRTMTELLREALNSTDESLNSIQKATGLKRQVLAKFMRGEQSLRLDFADELAAHFGIEVTKKRKRPKAR
jgi:plasmid maintenance system antidote protein VapI